MTKCNINIEQYISKSNDLINHLLTVGDHLGGWEQVPYVLGGLGSNYIYLVTNIINKKRILRLDEIFTNMHIYESYRKHICLPNPQIIQTNYTKNNDTTSSGSNTNSWSFLVSNASTQSSSIQDKDNNTSFNNVQC